MAARFSVDTGIRPGFLPNRLQSTGAGLLSRRFSSSTPAPPAGVELDELDDSKLDLLFLAVILAIYAPWTAFDLGEEQKKKSRLLESAQASFDQYQNFDFDKFGVPASFCIDVLAPLFEAMGVGAEELMILKIFLLSARDYMELPVYDFVQKVKDLVTVLREASSEIAPDPDRANQLWNVSHEFTTTMLKTLEVVILGSKGEMTANELARQLTEEELYVVLRGTMFEQRN